MKRKNTIGPKRDREEEIKKIIEDQNYVEKMKQGGVWDGLGHS